MWDRLRKYLEANIPRYCEPTKSSNDAMDHEGRIYRRFRSQSTLISFPSGFTIFILRRHQTRKTNSESLYSIVSWQRKLGLWLLIMWFSVSRRLKIIITRGINLITQWHEFEQLPMKQRKIHWDLIELLADEKFFHFLKYKSAYRNGKFLVQ